MTRGSVFHAALLFLLLPLAHGQDSPAPRDDYEQSPHPACHASDDSPIQTGDPEVIEDQQALYAQVDLSGRVNCPPGGLGQTVRTQTGELTHSFWPGDTGAHVGSRAGTALRSSYEITRFCAKAPREIQCDALTTLSHLRDYVQSHRRAIENCPKFRSLLQGCLSDSRTHGWQLASTRSGATDINAVALAFTLNNIGPSLNKLQDKKGTEKIVGLQGAPVGENGAVWCAWASTNYPKELGHILSVIFMREVESNVDAETIGSNAPYSVSPQDRIPLGNGSEADVLKALKDRRLTPGLYLAGRGTPEQTGGHGYVMILDGKGQWYVMNFNSNHFEAISLYEAIQRLQKTATTNTNRREFAPVLGKVRFRFADPISPNPWTM